MNKEKEIKAYLDGELLPEVRMKYEIAEEMGLLEKSVCERDRTDRRVDDETKKRETEKINE